MIILKKFIKKVFFWRVNHGEILNIFSRSDIVIFQRRIKDNIKSRFSLKIKGMQMKRAIWRHNKNNKKTEKKSQLYTKVNQSNTMLFFLLLQARILDVPCNNNTHVRPLIKWRYTAEKKEKRDWPLGLRKKA